MTWAAFITTFAATATDADLIAWDLAQERGELPPCNAAVGTRAGRPCAVADSRFVAASADPSAWSDDGCRVVWTAGYESGYDEVPVCAWRRAS